jgi:hypothetical protein
MSDDETRAYDAMEASLKRMTGELMIASNAAHDWFKALPEVDDRTVFFNDLVGDIERSHQDAPNLRLLREIVRILSHSADRS